MYYIFKSQMVHWQGINLRAELPDEFRSSWRQTFDWWESVSLVGLLPSLQFLIRGEAPLSDNYYTATQFDIYSERLIAILAQTGVRYETFPVSLIDERTRNSIPHTHRLFHLLEIDPAVDRQKSIIQEDLTNFSSVRDVYKLVLRDDFIKQGKAITRIKEFRHLTVVHEELKHTLEAANITGCSFQPVEEFTMGLNILMKNIQAGVYSRQKADLDP